MNNIPEGQKQYCKWAKGFARGGTREYHPYTEIGFFDDYKKRLEKRRSTMLKYKKHVKNNNNTSI